MAKNANVKTWTLDVLADGFRHSNPADDVTAPTIPTGLAAGAVTTSSVAFSWAASTDVSLPITYDVEVGGLVEATVSVTNYTVTGLAVSTTVSVRVRARDGAGNTSGFSAAVEGTSASGTNPVFDWPLQAADGRIHALPGINLYGSDSFGGGGRAGGSTGVNTYVIDSLANTNTVTTATGLGADTFRCTLEGFFRHNAGTRSKFGILAISGTPTYNKNVTSVGSNWSLHGQFAPVPGLMPRGMRVGSGGGDEWQIWHMYWYLGRETEGLPEGELDAFVMTSNASPVNKAFFVNCEFSRSGDELCDAFRDFDNCGFIYCAFIEPIGHLDATGDTIHQFGPLYGGAGGLSTGPLKLSFERCFIGDSVDRNPWIACLRSNLVNNLNYNNGRLGGGAGIGVKYNSQASHAIAMTHNLVRCMFVKGNNNNTTLVAARADQTSHPDDFGFIAGSGVFIEGCVQNGWTNPSSQSGFLTNTEPNFAVKGSVQTNALPTGRLTNLDDTVEIAVNPGIPTTAEKQAFFDLMKESVGVLLPPDRSTSFGRLQTVLNQVQSRLNGSTSTTSQLPINSTAAGGWWSISSVLVDPLSPGAHWHAAMPTAATRHDVLVAGTFSNGLSKVGYTEMEAWAIEQHYFRGGK